MKAMVCETCNSNDLVKQDGVYVCQHCGTKYIVDEAKNEGSVQVEGVATLDKLLQNGYTFLKLGEIGKASSVFTKVTEEYPENYIGWFEIAKIYTIFHEEYSFARESNLIEDRNNPERSEYYKLGSKYYKLAIENFEKAFSVAPEECKTNIISAHTIYIRKCIIKYTDDLKRELNRIQKLSPTSIGSIRTMNIFPDTKWPLIVGLLCLLLCIVGFSKGEIGGLFFLMVAAAIFGIYIYLVASKSKYNNENKNHLINEINTEIRKCENKLNNEFKV